MYVLNYIDLVVIFLATFRLSYMLVAEDGTFSITYLIRLIGMKPVPFNSNDKQEDLTKFKAWKESLTSNGRPLVAINHFGKMLSCVFCTSVWVGMILAPIYISLLNTYFVYLFYGLAASSITMFLNKELHRR